MRRGQLSRLYSIVLTEQQPCLHGAPPHPGKEVPIVLPSYDAKVRPEKRI